MINSAQEAMVPSTQRPIPLQIREDLSFERIQYRGVSCWVAKDPVALRYYRLQPEQHCLLRLLDGRRNLEELRDALQKEFPTVHLNFTEIQHLVTDLHQKGLVYSNRPGQAVPLMKLHRERRKKQLIGKFTNLLYLRLPGWDPERTLSFLYPYVRWMLQPWAVALSVLLVVSSWVLLLVQFDTFRSRLPEFQQFFGWPNLLYMWIVLAGAKILHEFGHGLSCKHFRGECHEMGVMLLVFTPCLYCDVSDSWVLPNKWKRIFIGGAGMYVEVILSALAIFVWWNTQPGFLNYLCLNLFFITTITTVIFNANPLMRFDGYYMLSDFLEIPNLRPKADRLLRDSFAWYCLGIETKPDPFMPQTGKVWFVLYAIAAALYRWFILAGITIFLYTVLKPYDLQSIGITLAVVSVGSIIGRMIYNVYKIITTPRIDPMDYRKVAVTLTVLFCFIAAGLTLPIPWHLESEFLLEPYQVQHVYTKTPGRLEKVHIQPGQQVEPGQLLAELSNDEKEDHYRSLKNEKKIQEAKIKTYQAMGNSSQEKLAQEKLRTIQEQLRDFEQQLEQLTIKAPIEGTVVAPSKVKKPELESSEEKLSRWFDIPIDKKNVGCFLESRTQLLSVAPDPRYQAVMLFDQSDRNDIEVGQPVELQFDHLPGQIFQGKIKDIAEGHQEFAPSVLSNKLGGRLPTVTDSQGRERLLSRAYQAIVVMDEDLQLMKSGMSGQARVRIDKRSAGQWLWRYLRETFHFRL